ncbi:MAG: thiamine pyrophosphate-dependent dehydrogenase E1 component subunit alpha, partial [Acidimicrobiia bacterium]|nr:thiamine pyrophosphate-dependent dehydrogenase E1 component subunit alpha [Acidimicrobiia bacterium]
QEGVAAGACSVLRPTDYITSTHRGHGHTLAKGAEMAAMFAELLGKEIGLCRGRGGSMHITDFSIGMLGANGIVAGGLGIAVGAGVAIDLRGSDQVAVSFFGDGATSRGPFHESLNLASVWELPVVFVCENNGWASTTASEEALAVPDIAKRAPAYAMASAVVDGNDVFAVRDAMSEAVDHARRGHGPFLLEAKTYRLKGHFVGDPMKYRNTAEYEEWLEKDPIRRAETTLIDDGLTTSGDIDEIDAEISREVEAAIATAEAGLSPDAGDVGRFLFAEAE